MLSQTKSHLRTRLSAWIAGLVLIGGWLGEGTTLSARNASAPWERIEPARQLLGGNTPETGRITIDLPGVSQDGSSVPLGIQIDHPMEKDNHIEELHLFASGNPSPEILSARFTPFSGEARLQTRVRLDGTQSVVALARTSNGEWLADAREIRITVSGCISQGTPDPDREMETRVRTPSDLQPGQTGEILTLIQHPMETGLRSEDDGKPIPQRIIREFRASLDGQAIVTIQLHRSVSANPFLRFPIRLEEGGQLQLEWEEDTGRVKTETSPLFL